MVELTGVLPRTRIRELLHNADGYVARASPESFGIAAPEAPRAGVPVIAMDASGAGESLRDDHDGFLVADHDEMRGTLLRLALDPPLAHRIHENKLTSQPPMSWPWMTHLHDRLYSNAADGRAEGSAAQVSMLELGS